MRLVYVDEAGISDKKQEPFLVVAGIIIDADKQLVALERHLDKIVARHIPRRRLIPLSQVHQHIGVAGEI